MVVAAHRLSVSLSSPLEQSDELARVLEALAEGERPYRALDALDLRDRIALICDPGVPAVLVAGMARDMAVSSSRLCAWAGLSPRRVAQLRRTGGSLAMAESERILGVARLIGQVERLVEQAETPDRFSAPSWVARWLDSPLPALGGRHPSEFLRMADGRSLLMSLAAQPATGAYW